MITKINQRVKLQYIMLVNTSCDIPAAVKPWEYEYQRNYPPPAYDGNTQSYSPQATTAAIPWSVTSSPQDDVTQSTTDVIIPANSVSCCRSGYCYQQQTVTNSNYSQLPTNGTIGQEFGSVTPCTYDTTVPSGYQVHGTRHRTVTSSVKKSSRKRNGMSVNVNTMLEVCFIYSISRKIRRNIRSPSGVSLYFSLDIPHHIILFLILFVFFLIICAVYRKKIKVIFISFR